jgi:hypothetical protein
VVYGVVADEVQIYHLYHAWATGLEVGRRELRRQCS